MGEGLKKEEEEKRGRRKEGIEVEARWSRRWNEKKCGTFNRRMAKLYSSSSSVSLCRGVFEGGKKTRRKRFALKKPVAASLSRFGYERI